MMRKIRQESRAVDLEHRVARLVQASLLQQVRSMIPPKDRNLPARLGRYRQRLRMRLRLACRGAGPNRVRRASWTSATACDDPASRASRKARRSRGARPGGKGIPPHHLNVLVYDADDRELVRVSVPLWLARKIGRTWPCTTSTTTTTGSAFAPSLPGPCEPRQGRPRRAGRGRRGRGGPGPRLAEVVGGFVVQSRRGRRPTAT